MTSPFSRSVKSSPKFYCESCGREVPPEDSECSRCGKKFMAVLCPRCGHSGHAGLFIQGCPVCGFQAPNPVPSGKSNRADQPSLDRKKRAKTAFREYSGRLYAAVILLLAGVLALLLFLYLRL